MANNYTIKMTPKAANDLDDIYRYISEKLFATSAATNILERIEKEIMRLREFPFSCNYVADEYLRNKGYRTLIVDNYVALYI
jgi:toxin ParE1/3/4